MNSAMIHCPYCSFKQSVPYKPLHDNFRIVCAGCGRTLEARWLTHGVMILPMKTTCKTGD
ncbi:hypothetical protein [Maridesulfovibrio sp. FT414]|uniref:hypothetical protein n=1 Tax=Maridesulfovibrio sp. FT414 TaxID=2979469 RepID=UPI003D805E0C